MTPAPGAKPRAESERAGEARGSFVDVRVRWRAGWVLLGAGVLLALVALARPLRPELAPRLRMADALALGLGIAVAAFLVSLRGHRRPERLAFYLFLILCLDGVDQLLRPFGWPVWPLVTVVIGVLAVVEPPGVAFAAMTLALGLQAADVLLAGLRGWPAVLATGIGWAVLVPALRLTLKWENDRLRQALTEIERLRHGLVEEPGDRGPEPTLRWLQRVSDVGRAQLHQERAAELDQLVERLVRVARQALKAHAVAFFEIDRARDVARLRAADGPAGGLDVGAASPLGEDPFAYVLDRRVPFYVTDFKRLLWELPYYNKPRPKVGTLLAVPVRLEDNVVGVLVADRIETQALTGDEPEVLEGFAAVAADAIRQVRDAVGREQSDAEFKGIYAVSNKLTEAHSMIGVRNLLLQSARQVTRFEGAAFAMLDEEHTRYTIDEAHGWAHEFEGREVGITERTWAGWVLRGQGQSLVLDDVAEVDEPMPLLVLDEPGDVTQSLLALPLRVGPGYGAPDEEREGAKAVAAPAPLAPVRLIGLLLLTGPKGSFDAPARRVLEMLANQAAATMHLLQLKERERKQAALDGLTGLGNRRSFDEELRRACARQDRQGGHFALLLLDLDHFKKLNDTYGHPAGDAALRHTARMLRRSIRGADLAARYGGEEFAVVLSATDETGALKAAEKIRRALDKEPIVFEGARIKLSASVGLAVWPERGAEPAALISAADRALYAAKQAGRNRVVSASALPAEAGEQKGGTAS